MRKANHDKLAVCLDIGHLNYSKAPMEEWFAELHQHIRYIHLSDNQGIYDDHMAIGDGTVDWLKFHRLIEKYRIHPMVTLEVSGMENVLKSIHFLKENKIFPFGGDSHGR